MAFWGIELEPGKTFTHVFNDARRRLRISKATLGIGNLEERSVVQCKVGDNVPIFICSLRPNKKESCTLDLEFEEEKHDVVFEVVGPTSVYLTGFYLGRIGHGEVVIVKKVEDEGGLSASEDAETKSNTIDVVERPGHDDISELKKEDIEQEIEDKEAERHVRTLPSGLVIEDLKMGNNQNSKVATPRRDISVHYTGQFKSDGFLYISTYGDEPFKFKLGVGEVIKGWEIGINGMRVGDKRRLTVPPSLAYGSKGSQAYGVAPDAWLVFEVEVVGIC